jgi:hypothetical protein
MDARQVWDMWRRILTSDALVDAVLHPRDHNVLALGLTADESAILADYASTPAATDFTIGAYRRGLVRNALNALKLTPLTHRLFHTSLLDVSAVAEDFVRSIHYRDDGPNFYRTAADFIAYLAELSSFSQPIRQDALALEAAAIALLRRLGGVPPAAWPGNAALRPIAAGESDRYVANRAATVVSTDHDLTPWLEDPLDFASDAELERSARHWLIYVPAAESAHAYAELSARAALAFALLSTPKTVVELASALDGLPVDEAGELIGSLAEVGAIVRGT